MILATAVEATAAEGAVEVEEAVCIVVRVATIVVRMPLDHAIQS